MTFACSGPGAPHAIARNIEIGYTHAAIAAGLLLASVVLFAGLTHYRIWSILSAAFVILHPAWTVSAIHGDCGEMKHDLSWVFTILAEVVIAGQIIHGLRIRLRPPPA